MTYIMKYPYFILSYIILLLASCTPSPKDVADTDTLPDIYPDYIGVTVPYNIAPLNFLLRDSCDVIYVTAAADDFEELAHHHDNFTCQVHRKSL